MPRLKRTDGRAFPIFLPGGHVVKLLWRDDDGRELARAMSEMARDEPISGGAPAGDQEQRRMAARVQFAVDRIYATENLLIDDGNGGEREPVFPADKEAVLVTLSQDLDPGLLRSFVNDVWAIHCPADSKAHAEVAARNAIGPN